MDPSLIKAAKLAHHASEELHSHQHIHTLDPKKDGPVSPIRHGLENMAKPAFWMAASLLAFTAVLKVAALAFGVPDPISAISPIASYGVSALAGAIWGAGVGFFQGYNHATEHNAKIARGEPDPDFERAHSRKRTIEKAVTHTPRKAIVAHGGVAAEHETAHAPTTEMHEHAGAATPRHVRKIIEEGPRGLSPKEVAQRIHEQRTSAHEASI